MNRGLQSSARVDKTRAPEGTDMATAKVPQINDRGHELRKVGVLESYVRWSEAHASEAEADAQAVRATLQRVLQREARA